ncbi:HDOD domain-containing protein [Desulfogranum marinum]|uniref:HDOD domain-containing protein n=1 Tax=Desulfogranum marinum TaxID=453220 RepID=UPI00196684CE|nr:HDOD domain-containing protein [Desulfogranum marinum]MBM9515196.1 HDOD domain-containing protein [Desulfogranum marinum]
MVWTKPSDLPRFPKESIVRTSVDFSTLSQEDARFFLRRFLLEVYQRRAAKLRAPSSIFTELQTELLSPEPEVEKLVTLIHTDQDIDQRLRKLANSAYYSGLSPVKSTRSALLRIGLIEFQKVFITEEIRRMFVATDIRLRQSARRLWENSLRCANLMEKLSKISANIEIFPGAAYSAGLIHDIGALYGLASVDYLRSSRTITEFPSQELIDDAVMFLHCERGEQLLRDWRFNIVYQDAARHHENDEKIYSEQVQNRQSIDILRLLTLSLSLLGNNRQRPKPLRECIHLPAFEQLGIRLEKLPEVFRQV